MNRFDPYLSSSASFLRLFEEYKKYGSLVVAFDFDGTIHDFHNEGYMFPMVQTLLQDLKKIGCTLICFTAREDLDYVRGYLEGKKIPFDKINENPDFFKCNSGKIYYNALLDDRAGLMQVFSELKEIVNYVSKVSEDGLGL